MTIDEIVKALTPGCCSEKAARESGCRLCCGRFDAVAEVRRMHAELEELRRPAPSPRGAPSCQVCHGDMEFETALGPAPCPTCNPASPHYSAEWFAQRHRGQP